MINYVRIQFLGAAGTVTGSKFYLEALDKKILIDCGMFQGLKALRLLNWDDLPVKVSEIDIVLLTHGHLDHVGYLPRLIKQGFKGSIIGTAPTLAITEIILRDSAKIHEEEAEKATKEGYSKHKDPLPYYTLREAEMAIKLFKPQKEDEWVSLSSEISFRFQYNGHIIGATFIELDINKRRFVFSGDIGRKHDLLLDPPKKPEWADHLFLESTYGNKLHPKEGLEEFLSELILDVIHKKGNLIIPSFAVERLQTLMYMIWKLYDKNKIPAIPIYVDSPMGTQVLEVFERFPNWHKLSDAEYNNMCNHIKIVQSYKETWETIDNPKSKIIIAGSGMVTGGRVLTYLKQLIDSPSTTVLLVGYQAEGTRGHQLQEGVHEIKIFGKYYPVNATIKSVTSLSAHADQYELLDWMSQLKNIPENVFLIHGEQGVLDTFRIKVRDTFNWKVTVPTLNEVVKIMI